MNKRFASQMKYLTLPFSLIKFWYPQSASFLVRTWRNLMLLLEEDLAVALMWRLLFTPLFHDSSVVGRTLSLIFRLSRILIGLSAFLLVTSTLLLIGGFWFALPVLAFFNTPELISRVLFLSGLGFFLIDLASDPHKKVWQVSDSNLWQAAKIKLADITFKKLLISREVMELLSNLELPSSIFADYEISNSGSLIRSAYELGKFCGSEYLGQQHFFVAAISEIPQIDRLLLTYELSVEDFKQTLRYLEKKRATWRRVYIWDDDFTIHHLKGVNRGWLGVPTPNLDLVSYDLTKEAATLGFADLIRSDGMVKEIVNVLSQESGRNVILVGPPGCGKTATLRHLAKQIVTGDAPECLATKRIVLLDLTKLLSGVKTQGDLAGKIKAIFEEIAFAQNIIIAIEEIHELGMGEVGSSFNLYSLMQPYFESDVFQFIGTTENEGYSKILEKNGSFARLFRKTELLPASEKDTIEILEYRSIEAERKLKIKVTFIAIKTTANLSKKLIHDRVLPDSAIAVFKESLTQAINIPPKSKWVTKQVVKKVISSRVKVPLMEVGSVDKDKLLNLEEEIHGRLIDQQQAVKAVADTLRRSVTGLREEGRPIGSFLFVGPTGSGKTELAKTLAEVYFKDTQTFIRFDMSEYQNPESVVRLIGSPGEGGFLTEAVRNRPYALLLLDEFEKANERILTLFLQVFEDGRLTDGAGRTVDFTNTIIIATSNAGSLTIANDLQKGKSLEVIEQEVKDELLKVFKPELVNRFDKIVLFKPLSPDDLQKVVKIKLATLKQQMKEKGYMVDFDEGIIKELAKRGFDPVLGARPLRRLMQDTMEANLSKLILESRLIKGQPFQADLTILNQ